MVTEKANFGESIKKMRSSLKSFLVALVIVALVLGLVALPYSLIQSYGLKIKKTMIFIDAVFLAVFSLAMLVWWIVRYRQTGKRIEALQEEIKRMLLEGGSRYGHRRT